MPKGRSGGAQGYSSGGQLTDVGDSMAAACAVFRRQPEPGSVRQSGRIGLAIWSVNCPLMVMARTAAVLKGTGSGRLDMAPIWSATVRTATWAVSRSTGSVLSRWRRAVVGAAAAGWWWGVGLRSARGRDLVITRGVDGPPVLQAQLAIGRQALISVVLDRGGGRC